MKNRYRWYRIHLPQGVPDLSVLIDSQPLGKSNDGSFTRVNGTFGHLIHRFLWKTKVFVTQFDENGEPSYQEVTTTNFTDFAILAIDNSVFLRAENPGRSIKNLLNALESLIGLGFTCNPVAFQKKKPTSVFESIDLIKLVGLKVTEAVLKGGIVARMEFASSDGINPERLTVLDGVPHKIESASYEFIYGGLRGLLSLNSSGTVKASGPLAPKLIHLIEKDLGKIS